MNSSDPTPPDDPDGRDGAADDASPGLFRSRSDRMLFGVSGGIAERYGFEPVLVRLAFLASLLLGGAGFLFYLAAALLVPAAPASTAPGTPTGTTPAAAATNGVLRVLVLLAAGIAVLAALGAAGALSFGLTLLFGAWPMAVALLLVAVLLVVAARRSRAATATLLLLALAFAVPATAATLADLRVDRTFGDRTRRPITPTTAAAGYRLGFGHLTVDLRRTAFTRGSRTTVPVRLGAGRLGVLLPDDRCVAWTIRTRLTAGDVEIFRLGTSAGGLVDQELVTEVDPPRRSRDDRPRVTLDLRARAGTIAVGFDQATISSLPSFGEPDRRAVLRSDGSYRTKACRDEDRRARR